VQGAAGSIGALASHCARLALSAMVVALCMLETFSLVHDDMAMVNITAAARINFFMLYYILSADVLLFSFVDF
jgi:hypothetical protein